MNPIKINECAQARVRLAISLIYQWKQPKMGRTSTNKFTAPKPTILADVHDPRVEVIRDLQGKVE